MQFEHLNKHHDRQSFDCGNVQINSYLHRLAGQHHKKGISKVHVLAQGSEIMVLYPIQSDDQYKKQALSQYSACDFDW